MSLKRKNKVDDFEDLLKLIVIGLRANKFPIGGCGYCQTQAYEYALKKYRAFKRRKK